MLRLASALIQLPAAHPSRALDVGCGDCVSLYALRHARPGWTFVGLDLDCTALRLAHQRDPDLRLICADARTLPGLLRAHFGLILVRHPDLFRRAAVWRAVIARLPALLAPGGTLLITVYAPEDLDRLAGLALPAPLALDERALAPVDMAGHDRYVRAYRAAGA